MRKLLILLVLSVSVYAVSPPYFLPENLSLKEFLRIQQMVNADMYRRLRKTNANIKSIAISTGAIMSEGDKKIWARDVRTEQYGNLNDDDVQGQLFQLDEDKLSRKGSAAKKYRSVDNTSIYWNNGSTDTIQLNGTNGQSNFSGTMTMNSTNTYWNNGVRNTLEVNPQEIYFSNLTSNGGENYFKTSFVSGSYPYPRLSLTGGNNAQFLDIDPYHIKMYSWGSWVDGLDFNTDLNGVYINMITDYTRVGKEWIVGNPGTRQVDIYTDIGGTDDILTLHGAVYDANLILQGDWYGRKGRIAYHGYDTDQSMAFQFVNTSRIPMKLWGGTAARLGAAAGHRLAIYDTETPMLYFIPSNTDPTSWSEKGSVGYDTAYGTNTLTIENKLGDIRLQPKAGSTIIGNFTGWISSATYAQAASTATWASDSVSTVDDILVFHNQPVAYHNNLMTPAPQRNYISGAVYTIQNGKNLSYYWDDGDVEFMRYEQ